MPRIVGAASSAGATSDDVAAAAFFPRFAISRPPSARQRRGDGDVIAPLAFKRKENASPAKNYLLGLSSTDQEDGTMASSLRKTIASEGDASRRPMKGADLLPPIPFDIRPNPRAMIGTVLLQLGGSGPRSALARALARLLLLLVPPRDSR